MLSQQGYALPLGLILDSEGNVEVSLATYERPDQIKDVVNAMQSAMAERVVASSATACCISFPDSSGCSVIAFLENHENYCAKVSIPIVGESPTLDAENLAVDDGSVFVFPVVSG